jgi:hypothetical protein
LIALTLLSKQTHTVKENIKMSFIEELEAYREEIKEFSYTPKTEALAQWAKEHTMQFNQELAAKFPVRDVFKRLGNSSLMVQVEVTIVSVGVVQKVGGDMGTPDFDTYFYLYEDQYNQATTEDLINLALNVLFGNINQVGLSHYIPFVGEGWRLTKVASKALFKERFPFVGY